MTKEELRNSQPVAWKILSRALKEDRISHAYLFYGPSDAPKSDMALLLAQSLFCPNRDEDGFACQKCESCQKTEQEESLDFFWIHPGGIRQKNRLSRKELDALWRGESLPEEKKETWRIRKEQILDLQESFARSAAGTDHQVYILEQYDTATPEASNSLLKFLEEPHAGLCGILTAEELGNVLPTIQSRCQLIAFRPSGPEVLKKQLSDLIEDEEMCTMLAENGWHREEIQKIEKDTLHLIQQEAVRYYENKSRLDAVCRVQTDLFHSKNMLTKTNVQLFLQWILYLVKRDRSIKPLQALNIRQKILESLDRLKKPVDAALLCDSTMYAIWNIMNPYA